MGSVVYQIYISSGNGMSSRVYLSQRAYNQISKYLQNTLTMGLTRLAGCLGQLLGAHLGDKSTQKY